MASVLVFKSIKPGRFQGRQAVNILLGATRKAGNDIKKDFEKTTKTWNHKVKFDMEFEVKNIGPTVLVGTDDEIYGYVNDGTPGHFIPVSNKALVYQVNYERKTRPGVIDSFAGGKWGPTTVRPFGVWHPGIEKPRKFDEVIQRQWESKFRRRIEVAMRRAARATGHAI